MHKDKLILVMKIAISIAVLVGVKHFVDLQAVWLKLQKANVVLVVYAMVCLMISYCLCGLRWAWVAEGLGLKINRWRKQQLVFLGLFVSLFMPSTIGGDLVRGLLMGRGRKHQKWIAYASIFFDRLNGFYALTLFLVSCLFFVGISKKWLLLTQIMVLSPWLLIVIYPLVHKRLPTRFAKWRDLPLTSKDFVSSWWRSFVLSMIIMSLVIQVHVFLGMSVGMNLSWQAYGVMVMLVGLASVLPVTFNGFGVREAGYIGLATYFGADASNAAAMAGLWVILLYTSALPGYLVIFKQGGFSRVNRQTLDD